MFVIAFDIVILNGIWAGGPPTGMEEAVFMGKQITKIARMLRWQFQLQKAFYELVSLFFYSTFLFICIFRFKESRKFSSECVQGCKCEVFLCGKKDTGECVSRIRQDTFKYALFNLVKTITPFHNHTGKQSAIFCGF